MSQDLEYGAAESHDDEIQRRESALRIGLTILFMIICGVVESLLVVIVLFELVVALVSKRPPNPRVRELANRILTYYYRIGRYLTYNESRVPFPFSDFPTALEGDGWRPEDRESKALGLTPEQRKEWEEDDDPLP